jgi:crotonobetainyl-CoA:carnitine CoA-transferase CaiB-like acyl-CoA transferase
LDEQFVSLGIVGEQKFWLAFCDAVGRSDLADRFADPLPQTRLIAEIADLFAARTLAEWESLLAPVETCFQPVVSLCDVPRHPHIVARQMIDAREASGYTDVRFPAWIEKSPPSPRLEPVFVRSGAELEWNVRRGPR